VLVLIDVEWHCLLLRGVNCEQSLLPIHSAFAVKLLNAAHCCDGVDAHQTLIE
jgi:hypothetical protein